MNATGGWALPWPSPIVLASELNDTIGIPQPSHDTGLTDHESKTLIYTATGMSFLSLFSIMAMMIVQYRWKDTLVSRLVFSISLADSLSMISRALGRLTFPYPFLCQTQAALMQWGDLMSVFWTLVLCLFMLMLVFGKTPLEVILYCERWLRVVIIAVPFLFAVVPWFFSYQGRPIYGQALLWCWIPGENKILQAALFFVPLWFVFLLTVFIQLVVARQLWRTGRQQAELLRDTTSQNALLARFRLTFMRHVFLYTLGFIVVWTPGSLNRALMMLGWPAWFPLMLAQTLASSSRGLVNTAVYSIMFFQSRQGVGKEADDLPDEDRSVYLPYEEGADTVGRLGAAPKLPPHQPQHSPHYQPHYRPTPRTSADPAPPPTVTTFARRSSLAGSVVGDRGGSADPLVRSPRFSPRHSTSDYPAVPPKVVEVATKNYPFFGSTRTLTDPNVFYTVGPGGLPQMPEEEVEMQAVFPGYDVDTDPFQDPGGDMPRHRMSSHAWARRLSTYGDDAVPPTPRSP